MGAGSWYATWHGIGSDFTCIGLWHQNHVYEELELFQGKDLMATAGRLKSLPEAIKPQTIVVDDAGLGGGVVDRLREQSVAVIAFNGGEAAQSKDKYYNRRAESYWSPREAFSNGEVSIRGTTGNVEDLIAELTSLKYDFRSDGAGSSWKLRPT